jgi:chromosome segregation ATPase
MFVADKLQSSEKMDFEQNKLINSQKRENEKLRRSLQDLNQELVDHERQAARTDQEVERLKDLSSKLKPAGEIQQQAAKASADKVEAMLNDVEKLKGKPGIDDKKYKDLVDRVNSIKSNAGNEEVEKVQQLIATLGQRQDIDDKLFNQVMTRLDSTQASLDAKEARFRKYIAKKGGEISSQTKSHGEEMKKYSEIINKYKDDIENFRSYMQTAKDEVSQNRAEVDALKQDAELRMQEMDLMAPMLRKAATQRTGGKPKSDINLDAERDFKQAMSAASPDAPTKVKTSAPKRAKKDLTDLEKSSEIQRSYGMAAQSQPKLDDNPFTQQDLTEDLRQYDDPEFLDWATKNMPVILRMFFNRYPELETKHGPEQVQEIVADYLPYLYQYDEIEMTTMNKFLDFIKNKLRAEAGRPVQRSLFNGLTEAYEAELDKIIGLDYIKTKK